MRRGDCMVRVRCNKTCEARGTETRRDEQTQSFGNRREGYPRPTKCDLITSIFPSVIINVSDSRFNNIMLEKTRIYDRMQAGLLTVLDTERDFIANMANCAALLFQMLPDLNWAGFYRAVGTDLVLGPFQGGPACIRIGPGRGVCGAAAARLETIVVPDVNCFPDHIACDAQSRSEVVVPLIVAGRLIGVLDLDSPSLGRFDAEDAAGLERVAAALIAGSDV